MGAAEDEAGGAAPEQASEQASEQALARPQRRLLRRLFNGRTVPLVVGDLSFRAYRDASSYLLSLPPDARDSAYAAIKATAKAGD